MAIRWESAFAHLRGARLFLLALAFCAVITSTNEATALSARAAVARIAIEESVKAGVPPSLALAIIKVESDFDASSAQNGVGVMGLPHTTRDSQLVSTQFPQVWDARTNVESGIKVLVNLYIKHGGDWSKVLADYAVKDLSKHSADATLTNNELRGKYRGYVNKVLSLQRRYQNHRAIKRVESQREFAHDVINNRAKSLDKYASADEYSAEVVRRAQVMLNVLGYDAGEVDGVYGARTISAIKEFEKRSGASFGGRASTGLLRALKDEFKSQISSIDSQASEAFTKDFSEPDFNLSQYKAYAVLIGNNEYENLGRLYTAANDASTIGGVLSKKYGFEVEILRNATRQDILDTLDHLRASLTADHSLLIYYAGHGYLDREIDRGYWQPVDAHPARRSNWISNADITDTLRGIAAKHVLVIADSCYSGALTRGPSRGIAVTQRTPSYFQKIMSKKSRTVLASGGLEPVDDGGGGGLSVFARAFRDVLRDNTGVLEGTELSVQIKKRVRLNAAQIPQYSNIKFAGHEVGGDFLFVPSLP